jgi:hypothetical protein
VEEPGVVRLSGEENIANVLISSNKVTGSKIRSKKMLPAENFSDSYYFMIHFTSIICVGHRVLMDWCINTSAIIATSTLRANKNIFSSVCLFGVTSRLENESPLLSVSRLFLFPVLMTLLTIFLSELISNVVKINLAAWEPCMYPEAVSLETC